MLNLGYIIRTCYGCLTEGLYHLTFSVKMSQKPMIVCLSSVCSRVPFGMLCLNTLLEKTKLARESSDGKNEISHKFFGRKI